MKIVVVGTRGFPNVPGGIESHCEHLYSRLVKLGCEIVVFTRKPYVNPDLHFYKGISLIPVDCPRNKYLETIVHTFKSILKARKFKPDILHVHSEGSYLFIPLARLLGMKVVITINTEGYKQDKWGLFTSWFVRLSEAIGMIFANKRITVSEPIASNLRRQYNLPVKVIPNGIDIPLLPTTSEILSKLGLRKHKYILTVSRLIPGKGVEDVIDAFNNGDFEGWKLVVVGYSEHKSKYCRDIEKKAQRNKNIILTGFIKSFKHIRELYTYAGLFVFPSYYEACPMVLLEALSYGLSCIISDIPAHKYFGLDESRFFKPGDIESITAKINKFINKPLTEKEKLEQIRFIAEKYNWDKIALETLEVYKQVILRN